MAATNEYPLNNARPWAALPRHRARATLAVGGALRGRYEARRDLSRGTVRDRSVFLTTGAVITGLGGALAISGIIWFAVLGEDRSHGDPLALAQAGHSTLAAGAGLLAYGLAYRKHIARGHHIRVLPRLPPGFAGFAVAGRF